MLLSPPPTEIRVFARGVMKTGPSVSFYDPLCYFVKGNKHLRQAFIAFSTASRKHYIELNCYPTNNKYTDISICVNHL